MQLLPEPVRDARCCAEQCRYRPDAVRLVLVLVRKHGLDALDSILAPKPGYDTDSAGGFGPAFGPTWRLYAADLERAIRAGHRTPEAIAGYLCAFALDNAAAPEMIVPVSTLP